MSDGVFEPVSVVIPALNEEESIARELVKIRQVMDETGTEYEIIVVDDGSSDNTAKIAEGFEGAELVRHGANRGYGEALKTGIRKAGYNTVVIVDADGTYPVEEIPRLCRHMDENEMVVGARTGKSVQIPFLRRPVKWCLGRLASYLARPNIPDLNSGLRVFRKDTVLRYFPILPCGFSFTTTITLAMITNDHPVKYIPIDYHRRKGHSKIRPFHDTLSFLMLIVRVITYFNPLRVFLPLSFILFAAGIGLLFFSKLVLHRVMDITVSFFLFAAFQVMVLGLLADLVAKKGEMK